MDDGGTFAYAADDARSIDAREQPVEVRIARRIVTDDRVS